MYRSLASHSPLNPRRSHALQDVDAVYIGTPHTYHYENAMDAIKAKKNVLCEKPVSCNSAELRSLIAAAKENNVFFMEALWTRFHPLALEVKKVIDEGSLGKPIVLHADLSGNFDIDSTHFRLCKPRKGLMMGIDIPTTHRILDPSLGGGALLDLYVVNSKMFHLWLLIHLMSSGPYPLVWVS